MLSNRLRPGVEAAPWVIEEVKKIEAQLFKALALICDLESKVLQLEYKQNSLERPYSWTQ